MKPSGTSETLQKVETAETTLRCPGNCAPAGFELKRPCCAKPRILSFFCAKTKKLCHQIALGPQFGACRLHAGLPFGWVDRGQRRLAQPVPDLVELPERGRCIEPVKKGVELVTVGLIVLRVDVPDQGPPGPQRSHHRVFAAHEIQVASPQG